MNLNERLGWNSSLVRYRWRIGGGGEEEEEREQS